MISLSQEAREDLSVAYGIPNIHNIFRCPFWMLLRKRAMETSVCRLLGTTIATVNGKGLSFPL